MAREQSNKNGNYLKVCEALNLLTSIFPGPDGTQPKDWENLTDESKQLGVQALEEILNGDFKGPEDLHNLWMRLKVDSGWTYGEFCLEKKQHPCIVPYDELIPTEKAKDEFWWEVTRIFKSVQNELQTQ